MSYEEFIEKLDAPYFHKEFETNLTRTQLIEGLCPVFEELHQNYRKVGGFEKAIDDYKKVLDHHLEYVERCFHSFSYREEREILMEIKSMWSLCVLLYLTPSTNLPNDLMEWFVDNNKYYLFEFSMQEIYNHEAGSLYHRDFWSYVIRLAICGKVELLRELFKHALGNSKEQEGVTESIVTLVDIMETGYERSRLLGLITKIDPRTPKLSLPLKLITLLCGIFLGDISSIDRFSLNRVHTFICSQFYNPKVTLENIFDEAKRFFRESKNKRESPFECILEKDMVKWITNSVKYDWWFLAHILDLLAMKGIVKTSVSYEKSGKQIIVSTRDYFVLCFGSYLGNTLDKWKQSYTYLLTCGEPGMDVILRTLSPQLRFTKTKMDQIIEFCLTNDHHDICQEFYSNVIYHCIRDNKFQEAISIGKIQGTFDFLPYLYKNAINYFVITKEIKEFDDLQYKSVARDVYRGLLDFHQAIENKNYTKATEVFNTIIHGQSIPNCYLILFLWNGLKLIEDESNYLDQTTLVKIQDFWRQLNQSYEKNDYNLFRVFACLKNEDDSGRRLFLDTTGVLYSKALDALDETK